MTFPINVFIPAAGNDPGDDQPGMQTNFSNINSYLQVDHTNPASTGAGIHKQVTIQNVTAPGIPSSPISIAYTQFGVAATSTPDLYFTNANGIFPCNILRACAFCSMSGITASQSVNVTSVTRASVGVYNVILSTNAVSSANFMVIPSFSSSLVPGSGTASSYYLITSTGNFTLGFRSTSNNSIDPPNFSFIVLQV